MIIINSKLKNQINEIGEYFKSAKLKLATAESCTGGMIGAVFTSVAGSSDWFNGGAIAYSNYIKMKLLSVSEKTLIDNGAVSFETVEEMAKGAAASLNADITVSVSGVAGPGGGTSEKPVGLVFIGLNNCGKVTSYKFNFDGDRDSVREQAVEEAVRLIHSIIK